MGKVPSMPQWTRIASKSDLPAPGQAREFEAAGKTICVANVDGKIAAMDNVCLHRGGSLGQGVVLDGQVICPWHGWAWNPQSGQALQDPSFRVTVYPVRIEGDDVLVEI